MSNVRVLRVPDSDSSVIVSWERIDVPGITGYRVYYSGVSGRKRQSEMFVTVPSTQNFATITGLMRGVEYQFQVAVTGMLQGQFFEGNRSEPNAMSRISLEPSITSQTTQPTNSQNGGMPKNKSRSKMCLLQHSHKLLNRLPNC